MGHSIHKYQLVGVAKCADEKEQLGKVGDPDLVQLAGTAELPRAGHRFERLYPQHLGVFRGAFGELQPEAGFAYPRGTIDFVNRPCL